MTYTWQSTPYSFTSLYTLQKGESGDKVAALQFNLGIPVDGEWGDTTEAAARDYQDTHGLFVDGEFGERSQAALIGNRARRSESDHNLPVFLLKSLAKTESNLTLAARSEHPSDWGYDLGPFQNSIGPEGDPDDQTHRALSYNIRKMAEQTATRFAATRGILRTAPYCEPGAPAGWYGSHLKPGGAFHPWVYATQLAALDHNWPGAADHLAAFDSIFVEPGGDDIERDWIIAATGGRLSTGREWVLSYIPKATQYVVWT